MRTARIGRWISRRKERRNDETKTRANRGGETGFAQWVELTKRKREREKEKEKEHWDRTWRTRKGKRESVTEKGAEKEKEGADREEAKRRGEPLPHCTLADAISPLSIRDSSCVLRRITRHYPFDPVFSHPQVVLTYTRTCTAERLSVQFLTFSNALYNSRKFSLQSCSLIQASSTWECYFPIICIHEVSRCVSRSVSMR